MHQDDSHYFRTRALQEQEAAQKAVSAAARQSHDQLASMYRFKAWMLSDPLQGPWNERAADLRHFDVRQSARMARA